MRPIGYYVHHQGIGHWQRARAIAAHLRHPCTLIGTFDAAQRAQAGLQLLHLPDDKLDAPPTRPGAHPATAALHYAPPGAEALRQRAALLSGWIRDHRPALMVVDVSVEIVLLARLCGTPVVSFRLAGRRDDPPHLAAFEASEALIAPFPAELDEPELPGWVRERTVHAGLLAPSSSAQEPGTPRRIAVVFGRGGSAMDPTLLLDAASATPGYHWQVAGLPRPVGPVPANLDILGWVDDPSPLLRQASLVIGGCGDGLLAEVAALGRRFICIPEPRPFAEQTVKAERLAAMACAITLPAWPDATAWPGILRDAEALDPARIAALHDGAAITRTAGFIDGCAEAVMVRYG
jgi:UDP-N-acetylglucosamine--N-acetylmuramyl-(pentapeptide) pyrophosphoryl-undecaprenol N-acetylglucosamine transferase